MRHPSPAQFRPRAVPQLLTAKDLEARLMLMPKRSRQTDVQELMTLVPLKWERDFAPAIVA